jgi:hypothetical protein
MKIDFKNLPSKVKNLHQIIASLAIENDSLRYQLKLLKAKKFGRLSEKLNNQIEQLELWIEENELTCAEAVATDFSTDSDASKELNKEKPKRLKFRSIWQEKILYLIQRQLAQNVEERIGVK